MLFIALLLAPVEFVSGGVTLRLGPPGARGWDPGGECFAHAYVGVEPAESVAAHLGLPSLITVFEPSNSCDWTRFSDWAGSRIRFGAESPEPTR